MSELKNVERTFSVFLRVVSEFEKEEHHYTWKPSMLRLLSDYRRLFQDISEHITMDTSCLYPHDELLRLLDTVEYLLRNLQGHLENRPRSFVDQTFKDDAFLARLNYLEKDLRESFDKCIRAMKKDRYAPFRYLLPLSIEAAKVWIETDLKDESVSVDDFCDTFAYWRFIPLRNKSKSYIKEHLTDMIARDRITIFSFGKWLQTRILPNEIHLSNEAILTGAIDDGEENNGILALKQEINFSYRDELGNTFLHLAASKDFFDLVIFLVFLGPVEFSKFQNDKLELPKSAEQVSPINSFLYQKNLIAGIDQQLGKLQGTLRDPRCGLVDEILKTDTHVSELIGSYDACSSHRFALLSQLRINGEEVTQFFRNCFCHVIN